MREIFTKKWFEATLIRMLRTGAEAALAVPFQILEDKTT